MFFSSKKLLFSSRDIQIYCGSCGYLHLCLLSPQHKLLIVQTTAVRHSIFYFSSFSMFIQSRISRSVVICSFCSFLFFCPLYLFHPILFYPSFSVPCSVFSLCLFALFSDLPYCFLFKSVILSFLFPITLFCLLLPYALFLFNLFSFY